MSFLVWVVFRYAVKIIVSCARRLYIGKVLSQDHMGKNHHKRFRNGNVLSYVSQNSDQSLKLFFIPVIAAS